MKLRAFGLALVTLGGLLLWLAPTPASADFKCWTNKEGVRECGNVVPPEYAQQGHEEISESGIKVTEVEGAKSEEELEAEHRRQEQEKLAEEARARQLTRDLVLLRTFTSEEELKLARDGKLAVIESRITLAENRSASLQANLEMLEEQAAQQERSGKGVQGKLAQDIEEVKRQLENNRAYVEARREDQDGLQAQFDADLTRFRALKSREVKPGQLSAPISVSGAVVASQGQPAVQVPQPDPPLAPVGNDALHEAPEGR